MSTPDLALTTRNRRKKIGEILLLGLVGMLMSGLLFVNSKYLPSTFLWKKILNSSHLLLFMALGLVVLRLFNIKFGALSDWPVRNYIKSLLAGSIFAFFSEWLQQFVGREFERHDILLNLAGILLIHGTCYFWANRKKFSKVSILFKICLLIGSVLLVVVMVRDLALTTHHYFHLQQQLPLITSFEKNWELFRWEMNGSTNASIVSNPYNTGQHCLRVDCHPGVFPGVTLEYPPQDWRRFRAMSFVVYQEEPDSFTVTVRIDDLLDTDPNRNRIYFEFDVHSGKNHFVIPFEEISARASNSSFDFSYVRRIVFFLNRPVCPRVFYLDEIMFF